MKTFYAVVGPMDVRQSIHGRKYDERFGYTGVWKNQRDDKVIGVSWGGTHLAPSQYWLVAQYAP